MPGRKHQSLATSNYRYSINGQERSVELNENLTTALYWEYDSRIGRRWNIDPKPTIGISDYSTFGNSPIINIDNNGDYFFGLFGSTIEQRHGAKLFAKETGGEVHNIMSKNVNVTYSFQASKDVRNIGVAKTKFYDDGFAKILGNEGHKIFTTQSNAIKFGYGRINPNTKLFEYILANGKVDMVDDPLTILGPGLIRGLFQKLATIAAAATTEEITAESASTMARAWQGKGAYSGVDNWRDITLKDGRYVVGGLPGESEYYTSLSGLNKTGLSKTKLWQGLQVQPHAQFGYRAQVGLYKVVGNTEAAFGTTYANSQFGSGGLPQIFIPNYQTLQLIKTIHLR